MATKRARLRHGDMARQGFIWGIYAQTIGDSSKPLLRLGEHKSRKQAKRLASEYRERFAAERLTLEGMIQVYCKLEEISSS